MKVKLNPAFEGMSGMLGEIVFRELRGKTVISRKPEVSNTPPSAGQSAHRERFKLAAAYGKSAMSNNAIRALYEEAAKRRDIPVFSVMVADYFNAPTLNDLDLSAYNGQVGDLIHVTASDDFGVANVYVSLNTAEGTSFESGDAVETAPGSGHWTYSTQSVIASGAQVFVNATATDHPGGTALLTKKKTF